jgi:glycosyltransferase involved in cell wall biosynthesis
MFSTMSTTESFVSVITPVLGQGPHRQYLECLAEQTYPKSQYEVLLVDNNPGPEKISISHIPNGLNLRVLKESTPGSYRARNQGTRAARGEILAFIDADCFASANWLEAGVKSLASRAEPGAVGGSVEHFSSKHPQTVEWYCLTFLGFDQKQFITKLRFTGAGNFFVRREVFFEVGPFDDRFKSAGDVEWSQRACKKGFQIYFAPEVQVRHPARKNWAEIFSKERRLIGGAFLLRKKGIKTFPGAPLAILGCVLAPLRPDLLRKILVTVPSPAQALKVWLLMISCRFVRTLEWGRLYMGGEPVR